MGIQDAHAAAFACLLQRFAPGAQLTRAWPLVGGVSAEVTALDYVTSGGDRQKAVARRHGPVDLARDPHIAAHESRLLQTVCASGLPAPAPLFVDDACDLFPSPVLVVAYVEGEIVLDPPDLGGYLHQLANFLAQLHAVDITSAALDFLPRLGWQVGPPPALVDESLSEDMIRRVLANSAPQARGRTVLLHGDFWPGNVLWRGDQLAAVVDWEDAALGDPLADVGNARLEILWALGEAAMTQFTARYQALTGADYAPLPYWDLRAALRPAGKLGGWGLPPEQEDHIRALHKGFVQQAMAQIEG
ncbi:MAG: phosphotransferase [Caldilineaceae bacterium]